MRQGNPAMLQPQPWLELGRAGCHTGVGSVTQPLFRWPGSWLALVPAAVPEPSAAMEKLVTGGGW